MQVHIRAATVKDLKTIKSIDETIFGADTYPLFALRQLLDITSGLLLVAVKETQTLGYILGHHDSGSGRSWFLSLGVLPESRGQGIGEKLIQALLAESEARGATAIYLTVHPENAGAIRLYNRLGFKAEYTEADYYGDGAPRIVMVRPAAKA